MTTSSDEQLIADLEQAAGRGDHKRLEQIIEAVGPAADPLVHRAVAKLRVSQCRWRKAVEAFDRVGRLDESCRLQRQLAMNLESLQRHRPATYKTVLEGEALTRCDLVRTSGGHLTIRHTIPGGASGVLTRGDDPRREATAMVEKLAPSLHCGCNVFVFGAGDGFFLERLARDVKPNGIGRVPAVFVIEPDVEVILHGLMLSDHTGPDGPIERENFLWFAGPQWSLALDEALHKDSFLPVPTNTVHQSLRCGDLEQEAGRIAEALVCEELSIHEKIRAYYGNLPQQHFADLFGPGPSRPPRLLTITSRFTTVLQYATADVADAFEQLGWQVQLLIEQKAHHQTSATSLRRALADFQPDLVFVIDHLRHELMDVFPPDLPYVCWIQDDHLAHLRRPEAAASIAKRDFVLTAIEPLYTQRYGYPARQCIEMGKVTRPPRLPASWTSEGEDLVFVSNASATGEKLRETIDVQLADDQESRAFMHACCDRLDAIYEQGDSICTIWDVGVVADQTARDLGYQWPGQAQRDQLLFHLYHPVNDTLYRQQALAWVIQIARRHGWRVGLYGQGWLDHPTFAPYARGPVAYGEALEQLTRRSRINLQIVPYSCMHQRLLDGLTAGGFFLVRTYAGDPPVASIGKLLGAHLDPSVTDVDEALASLAQPQRAELRRLFDRRIELHGPEPVDPVQRYQRRRRQGIEFLYEFPPDIDEVSFEDADRLEQLIVRFIEDEPLRRRIADAQRQFVERYHTYQSGMQRVVRTVGQIIGQESIEGIKVPRVSPSAA
jgi:hypothetical protein